MTPLTLIHRLPAHAGNIYAGIFRTRFFLEATFYELTPLTLIHQLPAHAGNIYAGKPVALFENLILYIGHDIEALPPLVHLEKPDQLLLDSLKLKLARWVLSGFEVCLA